MIQNLPKDLTETYTRIFSRIVQGKDDKLAKRVFKWVTAAMRPLSVSELQEALAIEAFAKSSQPERFIKDKSKIVTCCEGLILREEMDDEVHFAHPTVVQLLLSNPSRQNSQDFFKFNIHEARNEAGISCVTYLNFSDFKTRLIKPSKLENMKAEEIIRANFLAAGLGLKQTNYILRHVRPLRARRKRHDALKYRPYSQYQRNLISYQATKHHTFLNYASEHWLAHSSTFHREDDIWHFWSRLLIEENDIVKKPWTDEDWAERNRVISSCIVGYDHRALLDFIESSDAGFTPDELQWMMDLAASSGKASVVETLCASLRAPRSRSLNLALPLVLSAQGDHIEAVNRLLAAKADVNASAMTEWGSQTPLQAAAEGGHIKTIECLLAAKADVNAPAAEEVGGRTALQAAAEGGHIEVVERLLAAKADVNAPPELDSGRTALQAAARRGHVEIVARLLASKADVNAPAAAVYGRTALRAAAGGGYVEVVQLLLAAHADVNTPAAKAGGLTALQAAAKGGHIEVVEQLLAAEADVNAPAALEYGWTALQAAAAGDHAEVVERLLAAKADVNAPAALEYGRTALQAAAEGGHVEVVERLLAANADVNAPAAKTGGQTALRAAEEGGHSRIVELLRERGGPIRAISNNHRAQALPLRIYSSTS